MRHLVLASRYRRACASALVLIAAAACSRTDLLDDTDGIVGGQTDGGVEVDGGAITDGGGEDGGLASSGPDAAPASCSAGSLLPGATIPAWSISVQATGELQPGTDSILEDAYAVTVASDGSIFAAGCGDMIAIGPAEFMSGAGPCFLVKLDANGRPLFVNRFGDDVNDPLTVGLEDDHAGGVLVGLRGPDGCGVERLNACGEVAWALSLSDVDCVTSFAFAGDANGNMAIAGSCAFDCNGGSAVLRLDESGTVLSRRTLNGAAVFAAAIQSDGTLLLGGYGQGNVDFGAGAEALGESSLFLATYDPQLTLENLLSAADYGNQMQAAATLDGSGFVITGVLDRADVDLGGGALTYSGASLTGGQNQDIFLARLTTRLGHVFSQGYGDTSEQDTTSLCLDPDGTASWVGVAGTATSFGGLVISGNESLLADGFLARFGPDGTPESVVETPSGVGQLGCTSHGYALGGHTAYPADLGAGVVPTGGYLVKRPRP
jgi:hypothetical protein